MNTEQRLHYLQAMGITLWQSRKPYALSHEPAIAHPVPAPETKATLSAAQPSDPPEPSPAQSAIVTDIPNSTLAWEQLITEVEHCTACPLHASRTRAVFGVGDRQADWMVIGEAPGADEDRLGEPFVGRAGRLLDPMLKAIGLSRERVFIANILKSRPPDNRNPLPDEIRACWPYLQRQIELVQPQIFLLMGRIAAQTVLDTQTPVGQLRGQVHRFQDRPLIVTYHPAYLLRSPAQKAKAWEDLQLAQHTFASLNRSASDHS